MVNDNEISIIALAKLTNSQQKIKIDEKILLKFITMDEKTRTTQLEIINHKKTSIKKLN
ncbi:hypothetical protein [Candidatus Arsenophonus triatominarum]|uniref:hypothetical protein n=1 Tax=Candidatus Arsenophonus triatominarum TaxID=57911 RepID=UPI000AC6A7BC|nr:hypothetical protein [Candidatus Arsenophonus triatominarum]